MGTDLTKFWKRLKLIRSEVKVEELVFAFIGRIPTYVVQKCHSEDRADAGGLRDLIVGR